MGGDVIKFSSCVAQTVAQTFASSTKEQLLLAPCPAAVEERQLQAPQHGGFFISFFTLFCSLKFFSSGNMCGLRAFTAAKGESVTSSAKLSSLCSLLSLRSVRVSTKYHGGPKYKEIDSDSLGEKSAT